MRYESIELIGYIGFYNGMSLNQIKIDLTQCISSKIVIRGSNGSGKSTLMSAIHLLPDSNDNFIPTMEARKTLIVTDGSNRYVIRYIHPVTNGNRGTTKGFISKSSNGEPFVELNPSGIITTCKDIIYDEFSFDAGFASLAQLSSEDRGLVDKKPVERKRMINSIVSSLEVYNEIYRNVNKKYSVIKNLMSSLTSKIDMIGEESKLMAAIQHLSKQISDLENERQMTTEAIAATKLKLASIKQTLEQSHYPEVVKEIKAITKVNSVFELEMSEAFKVNEASSVDELRQRLESVVKLITALEANINSLNTIIPEYLKQRESEVSHLHDKQSQLEALQSDSNFTSVREILSNARAKCAEYEMVFNQMGLANINLITKDEFSAAMDSINRLRGMAEVLIHNHLMADIEDYLGRPYEINGQLSTMQNLRASLEEAKATFGQLTNQSVLYATKREIAKELMNRPKGCKIDNCVYIAEALKAERDYPQSTLDTINQHIAEVEQEVRALTEQINHLERLSEVKVDVDRIESELDSHIKFIMKLPVRRDFKETFLSRAIALDDFSDIAELYKYIDCGNMLEEYKLLLETIRTYEAEEKMYASKMSLIDSIIAEIDATQKKIDYYTAEVASSQDAVLLKQTQLKMTNATKDSISDILKRHDEEYVKNLNRLSELNQIKTTFDESTQEIEALEANLIQLNSNIAAVGNEIKNLSNQREGLNHSILMLNEYKTELEQYRHQFTMIEKVRYYSSPTSGIQTVYIGIFMNRILSTANQLLSLLFGGEFVLQPFIVNDNEFRIPILGDGLLHDDISSMSSAQKALISMIISFALLQQSSTKYNVLVLDECDGCMDQSNRFAFVQLLDSLMSMLHCEQCFIVSHNSELDTSDCDIIALKNTSNELINGHVIWQY